MLYLVSHVIVSVSIFYFINIKFTTVNFVYFDARDVKDMTGRIYHSCISVRDLMLIVFPSYSNNLFIIEIQSCMNLL